MTYTLGWKFNNVAYLFSDSAMSSEFPLESEITTFGEEHFSSEEGGKNVEERLLKIYKLDNLAFAYAGRQTGAKLMYESVLEKSKQFALPSEIAREAYASVYANPLITSSEFIFAYFEDGLARLAGIVDNQWKDDISLFQTGSMPSTIKDRTALFLNKIPDIFSAKETISLVLSMLQSYGVNTSFMNFGVGGNFYGCYINELGTHWQPDLFYVVHDKSFTSDKTFRVVSLFRDDFLCIISSSGPSKSMVLYNASQDNQQDLEQKLTLKEKEYIDDINSAEYDFSILISKDQHGVVVIEMLKKSHPLLNLAKGEDFVNINFNDELKPICSINDGSIGNNSLPGLIYFKYYSHDLHKDPWCLN